MASIQPPRSPGPPQTRPLPYQVDTAELAPQLAQVEEEIRRQIKLRAKIHVTERVVLLRAFGKVLGKKDVEIQPVDKITPEQLSLVTSSLGVALSPQLSYAIFNKIGQDVRGRMPVLNFVDALLYGAPRQIMLENDHVQQGAYKAGKPATHVGKIKYPQCKKGVWPPSDWDPRLAARSAELPDARLKLEFVYGYDGVQGTAPNLFYTSSQEVVYVAAAIGVVYNPSSHTQRFFLGHDDDILSLAIHPNRQLVATGQVGKDPMVKVWDSQSVTEGGSCRQVVSLSQGEGNRGVTALCFSPDGSMLACVCTDDTHTMIIWDWRKKQKLMERKSYAGTPPATYGVVWSGYEPDRLVTYGQNHIKVRRNEKTQRRVVTVWDSHRAKTYILPSSCMLT